MKEAHEIDKATSVRASCDIIGEKNGMEEKREILVVLLPPFP